MNITAKQPERSNIICVFPKGSLVLPEPAKLFSVYTQGDIAGSQYSDNGVMGVRVFEFPALGLQWVFEPDRIRIEDRRHRSADESKLGQEIVRVIAALYPNAAPTAYGFNYDILYRMDNVIPLRDVMAHFVKTSTLENVQDFGWQYSLSFDKGARTEMYFFKVVTPIEFSIHANFHFNRQGLPTGEFMQTAFAKGYADADQSLKHMVF